MAEVADADVHPPADMWTDYLPEALRELAPAAGDRLVHS